MRFYTYVIWWLKWSIWRTFGGHKNVKKVWESSFLLSKNRKISKRSCKNPLCKAKNNNGLTWFWEQSSLLSYYTVIFTTKVCYFLSSAVWKFKNSISCWKKASLGIRSLWKLSFTCCTRGLILCFSSPFRVKGATCDPLHVTMSEYFVKKKSNCT